MLNAYQDLVSTIFEACYYYYHFFIEHANSSFVHIFYSYEDAAKEYKLILTLYSKKQSDGDTNDKETVKKVFNPAKTLISKRVSSKFKLPSIVAFTYTAC